MRALQSILYTATLVAAAVLAPAATAQEHATFELEQVLSAPFPSELVATHTGDAVAWVFNARGVRNIWIARAPDYTARALTAYEEDDGQPITELAWTPDGGSIVFVRGGAPNRQGETPNPWSRPEEVVRQIMIVDLAGGDPRALAKGASPVPAPSGDAVIFLRNGDIWSVPPEGGDPEVLVSLRGRSGSLAWSPDGSRLAFVSNRGDHAFVGVYDAEDRTVTWMDPSVDRDASPVWSPDGRRIAFLRIPARRRPIPFTPEREAEPWSIRVADPATGDGHEIWRADPGVGSAFRQVVAANQLAWTANDRIVFPWEKDGWTHLYSVPAGGGGGAILLTPGAFEVEHVTLSTDRRHVIYNSNQDDIDRRHLWKVPAAGGRPSPLTRGDGIEWSPVALGEGATLALLRSDARRPARPAILRDGSIRDLAASAIPADFPSEALVAPEPVVFTAADGLQIRGQLFVPAEREGRHPAVIFFHGGSRRQMLLGWHYRGYYHRAYALNQYLANRGYVVLSVNYRSGIGYGLEFREALNYGAGGASEFNDVLGAGLYLRERPDVNPAAIGLWGGSYGGYLTALGLARASDLFAAGVDLHGVHDWNVVGQNFYSSYDTLRYPEAARTAFAASPMADIDTWTSPVLLIHGDDDRNVPFSETVDLAAALRAHGVTFEQLVFPDEVHGFLTHARWLAAYRATADFFDRYLTR